MDINPKAHYRPTPLDLEMSDHTIITAICNGDKSRFTLLYNKYEKQIFSYVWQMLNQHPQDTEDICSEIWIKVYRKLPQYNFKTKFFSWVYAIAKNHCFDYLRKKRNHQKKFSSMPHNDEVELPKSQTITIEDKIINLNLLNTILTKLSPKDRNLIILRYLEGYQPSEIANLLNIPTNRVSVQLNRALNKARNYI